MFNFALKIFTIYEVKMHKVQITILHDTDFAEETARRINKDYKDQAIVKDGACYVTEDYFDYCKRYVLNYCKIKE